MTKEEVIAVIRGCAERLGACPDIYGGTESSEAEQARDPEALCDLCESAGGVRAGAEGSGL